MPKFTQELKDQLFMTRRKRHFRGFAPCGLHVGHTSEKSAQQIAKLMTTRSAGEYEAYECRCCDQWHIMRVDIAIERPLSAVVGPDKAEVSGPAVATKQRGRVYGWDRAGRL